MTDPFSESSSIPAEKTELSEREREILKLLATGVSNKEIAQQLFISPNTVKVHLRNIFAKTGAASRTEATLFAIRTGLVQVALSSASAPTEETGTPETERQGEASSISSLPAPISIHEETPTPLAQPTTLAPRRSVWPWVLGLAGVVVVLGLWLTRAYFPGALATPTLTPSAPPPIPTPMVARWLPNAPLPAPRRAFAIATYNNQIYVIGGETSEGVSDQVARYDPVNDVWTTGQSKPLAVSGIGAAVIGGRVYVPGGQLADGVITNTVEVYDPATDSWQRRAPLPVALSAYAIVAFEGQLYLFGGWDGVKYVNTTYVYSPADDNWTLRTPMPTLRGYAGAAVAGGKIYVIGGMDGTRLLTVNEAYSPEADTDQTSAWEARAPLPTGRAHMGLIALADLIYLVGGEQQNASDVMALEYVAAQDLWQGFDAPALTASWTDLGLVAIASRLYAMGGTLGNNLTDQALNYQAIFTVVFPIIQQ